MYLKIRKWESTRPCILKELGSSLRHHNYSDYLCLVNLASRLITFIPRCVSGLARYASIVVMKYIDDAGCYAPQIRSLEPREMD